MKIKAPDRRPLLLQTGDVRQHAFKSSSGFGVQRVGWIRSSHPRHSRGATAMAEKEKKETNQPGSPGGLPTALYDVPSQESIDVLIRLLREFDRRSREGAILPPEIEQDIAVVAAAFKSIQNALALRDSPLRISGLSPLAGAAGTRVTITGSNFLTGSTVRFAGRDATDVEVVSLTEIQATAPSGPSGAVDVVVNTLAGSVARVKGFTYPASY
jgi:hypothetical protein